MKTMKLMSRKICSILLIAMFVLLVGCANKEVVIKLELSASSITKGETVDITTTITGTKDHDVHLSISNPELLSISDDNKLTVIKDIVEETTVTVIAVANADKTKSDSKKIIVKPVGSGISIEMTADKTVISKDESAIILVAVAGGNDKTYGVTVSHPELVEVKGNTVSVIGDTTVDVEVTVTATSNADSTVSALKVFTIKGVKPSPIIILAKNSITEGEEVKLNVEVNGILDQNYKYEVSDPDLLEVNGNTLTVKGKVTEEKFVTITAVLKTDETVRASKDIYVTIPKSNVGISVVSSKNTITKGEEVDLVVSVSGTEDKTYKFEVSLPELVSVTNDVVTVIGDTKVDKLVTITIISVADPTIKTTKTLTVKAPIVEGEVGELTSDKLAALGNPSITVSGVLTDYYVDFNMSSNNETSKYDMKVEMDQDTWVGTWNTRGQEQNVITDHYRKGLVDGLTDINGDTGHGLELLYINKNNEVSTKKVTDNYSIPVLWETRHFWNHLGNLQITKFSYDPENKVYEYSPDMMDEDEAYLMTYLSFSLTPLLDVTLEKLYLVIEDGEITKLLAQTGVEYFGGNDTTDSDAMFYTEIELNFSNVGKTEISEPAAYTAPQHADKLENALTFMKSVKNYSYKLVDVRTVSPQVDPGEYETDSLNLKLSTGPTSKYKDIKTSVGTEGSIGKITEQGVHFIDTMKYMYTFDGKDYSISHSGLKQNDDNTYDVFKYDSNQDTLVGTKKVYGNIYDVLPNFEFSANLFDFTGTSVLKNGKTAYHYTLREPAITKDIALEVSAYKYTNTAEASSTRALSIVVDEDGKMVSTIFPYNINDTYLGYCTTEYYDFGTTALDTDMFDNYISRQWRTKWSDYTTMYYSPNFSTATSRNENTETVLTAVFGESASDMPAPSIFLDVFGDSINGPFYDWSEKGKDADGNPIYYDYVGINASSEDLDENGKPVNYDEIIAQLTTALEADGFILSIANTDQTGGPLGINNKYTCFIKGDIQIVIENNYTKNFFIDFYKTGDWTLKK